MHLMRFYATWCGPCRASKPDFLKFVETNAYNYEDIDIDENREKTDLHGVTVVPTVLVLDDNDQEIHRFIGPQTYSQFEEYFAGDGGETD